MVLVDDILIAKAWKRRESAGECASRPRIRTVSDQVLGDRPLVPFGQALDEEICARFSLCVLLGTRQPHSVDALDFGRGGCWGGSRFVAGDWASAARNHCHASSLTILILPVNASSQQCELCLFLFFSGGSLCRLWLAEAQGLRGGARQGKGAQFGCPKGTAVAGANQAMSAVGGASTIWGR